MEESSGGNAFGTWLKRQLERREWTQADFSRQMSKAGGAVVTNGMVSNWILGRRHPRPETVDRMADVLGLPLFDVMVAAGHLPPETEDTQSELRSTLLGMVERVNLDDPTRGPLLLGILQGWIDFDRKQKEGKV